MKTKKDFMNKFARPGAKTPITLNGQYTLGENNVIYDFIATG